MAIYRTAPSGFNSEIGHVCIPVGFGKQSSM